MKSNSQDSYEQEFEKEDEIVQKDDTITTKELESTVDGTVIKNPLEDHNKFLSELSMQNKTGLIGDHSEAPVVEIEELEEYDDKVKVEKLKLANKFLQKQLRIVGNALEEATIQKTLKKTSLLQKDDLNTSTTFTIRKKENMNRKQSIHDGKRVLRAIVSSKETIISNLKRKLDKSRDKIISLKRELKIAHSNEYLANLQSMNKELRTKNAELQREKRLLTNNLKSQTSCSSALSPRDYARNLSKLQNEARILKERLRRLQTTSKTHESVGLRKHQECELLRGTIRELRDASNSQKKEVKQGRKDLIYSEIETGQHKEEIDRSLKEVKLLKHVVEQKDSKIKKLKKENLISERKLLELKNVTAVELKKKDLMLRKASLETQKLQRQLREISNEHNFVRKALARRRSSSCTGQLMSPDSIIPSRAQETP
eukprot:snap_masked-scaffold_60-processed-gene-0.10-mRNA-1 protein AED:1.00 eAED:1.00 QI:0/-1/0/0/-1/1/1/0/427